MSPPIYIILKHPTNKPHQLHPHRSPRRNLRFRQRLDGEGIQRPELPLPKLVLGYHLLEHGRRLLAIDLRPSD